MSRVKKTKAESEAPKGEAKIVTAVVEETPELEIAEPQDANVESEAQEEASESTVDLSIDQPIEIKPDVIKQVGFMPLFLGGVVAAGIGFAGAIFLSPDSWPFGDDKRSAFETKIAANLATQKQTINALRGQVTDLAAKSDTSAIAADATQALHGIEEIRTQLNALSAKANDFQFRLSDLEKRPITEGISDAAIAAFEAELTAVQNAMAAQRSEIEVAAESAARMEVSAQISEAEALKRAALSQIQTALDVGSGFPSAVANLTAAGQAVPQALVQVSETGVASIATLQKAFPVAARATLATANGTVNEEGGFGAFLRNQLGARSLEPKGGDSVDAILSRAEGALREGRLLDASAELKGLPEAGQAAMADWQAMAEKRQEALAAVEVLSQQMNSN